MDNKTTFLLKVLILSLGLSVFIKFIGPLLSVPESSVLAAITVCLPSVILAVFLSWRLKQHSQQPESLGKK
jgi:membrane protein implicated in regulation of membrane protease activity